MKRKFLPIITLFAFVINYLHGQYIPIVEEGKFWIYLNHIDEDHPVPVSGHAITFQGDTIINALTYKKVFSYNLQGQHDCPFPPCFEFDIPYQTTSRTLISFIREDSIARKVFNLPALNLDLFCDTDEHLLFDFSLAPGDTLNTCIYTFIGGDPNHNPAFGIVDSIKATEVFEKNRTTFCSYGYPLHGGLAFEGEVQIFEGVGLANYGLYHEPLTYLVDFCEGDMEACGILSSDATIENKKDVTIFPNPTNGILQIGIEEKKLKNIRVYSMMGELLAEFVQTGTIDISQLAGGVYFLELNLENDQRIVEKVIKEIR